MRIQYEKAPIIEAIIDIRVEPLPAPKLHALEAIYESVKEEYPERNRRMQFAGELSIGERVDATTQQTQVGVDFRSRDGKRVFQARLDGFSLSRLKPYSNWNELRDEARKLWSVYRGVIGSQKILRVAVRYINQIDIPLREIDYKDFFLTTPEISPKLSQLLSGFFMRLQMPQVDFGGLLILTQTTVPSSAPGTHSVILDLDVIKDGPEFTSDDAAWEMLGVLRARKNEYFEGCLTDRARDLFGERRLY